jgi:hypothetical protein
MRSGLLFCLPSVFAVLLLASLAAPQELSSQPSSGKSVCVAVVNNHTAQSLFVERMTERLARSLSGSMIKAVAMDSSTTGDRILHPTAENGAELKRRECDYLVLTQVTDPKDHNPTELRSPDISIGKRTPSVDASDPPGGQSGPVYRDNLEVNFALFRPGTQKAMLDTRILDQPSGNVSDSLIQTMDRVGNRISHELKKK